MHQQGPESDSSSGGWYQCTRLNFDTFSVNMPYPIWKHFVYGQLAARIRPDHICLIQLSASDSVPFFQRWHGSYCAKPTQIQSGWPGQGLAKCMWSGSKPVCRNHWAWFMAGYNWPATSLPLSDSVAFFHRCPRSYHAKPARIWFNSGWLHKVLAKMGLVRKQASVQETSGQCFQADLDWKCELDPTCLLGYMHVLQFMPSTVPFRLGFRPLCWSSTCWSVRHWRGSHPRRRAGQWLSQPRRIGTKSLCPSCWKTSTCVLGLNWVGWLPQYYVESSSTSQPLVSKQVSSVAHILLLFHFWVSEWVYVGSPLVSENGTLRVTLRIFFLL